MFRLSQVNIITLSITWYCHLNVSLNVRVKYPPRDHEPKSYVRPSVSPFLLVRPSFSGRFGVLSNPTTYLHHKPDAVPTQILKGVVISPGHPTDRMMSPYSPSRAITFTQPFT
jgi:hypothetical protein